MAMVLVEQMTVGLHLTVVVMIRGLLEEQSQVMVMVPVEQSYQQRSTKSCMKKLIRGLGPMLRRCS